ncbi:MAG: hypothetical protein WAP52_03055 [Candidatus Sungiibacteriota bacterium]
MGETILFISVVIVFVLMVGAVLTIGVWGFLMERGIYPKIIRRVVVRDYSCPKK